MPYQVPVNNPFNVQTPLTSAPNVPQLSGGGSNSAAAIGAVGSLLGGFLGFGGGGGGAALGGGGGDSSTTTISPNQSGGTNTIQVTAGQGILPWITNSAGLTAWGPFIILGIVAVLAWFILRSKK